MVTVTPAQVWARGRHTGEMVYLSDGGADDLRERTRNSLVCPVPGCHGEFTTRGGARRRHHFVHLHTPDPQLHTHETITHAEGKALLAQWAAHQPGVETVHVECRLNNGRVPDVLVVFDDGSLLDLEMECKVSDAEGRAARDRQLSADGIATQWVWGAGALRGDSEIRQDVRETLSDSEVMLYLDPHERTLTALIPRYAELCPDGQSLVGTAGTLAHDIETAPLDEVALAPSGVVHSAVRRHRERLGATQREHKAREHERRERESRDRERKLELNHWAGVNNR